jgi:hypothetical protein
LRVFSFPLDHEIGRDHLLQITTVLELDEVEIEVLDDFGSVAALLRWNLHIFQNITKCKITSRARGNHSIPMPSTKSYNRACSHLYLFPHPTILPSHFRQSMLVSHNFPRKQKS